MHWQRSYFLLLWKRYLQGHRWMCLAVAMRWAESQMFSANPARCCCQQGGSTCPELCSVMLRQLVVLGFVALWFLWGTPTSPEHVRTQSAGVRISIALLCSLEGPMFLKLYQGFVLTQHIWKAPEGKPGAGLYKYWFPCVQSANKESTHHLDAAVRPLCAVAFCKFMTVGITLCLFSYSYLISHVSSHQLSHRCALTPSCVWKPVPSTTQCMLTGLSPVPAQRTHLCVDTRTVGAENFLMHFAIHK